LKRIANGINNISSAHEKRIIRKTKIFFNSNDQSLILKSIFYSKPDDLNEITLFLANSDLENSNRG
jgi:hypothetical protein